MKYNPKKCFLSCRRLKKPVKVGEPIFTEKQSFWPTCSMITLSSFMECVWKATPSSWCLSIWNMETSTSSSGLNLLYEIACNLGIHFYCQFKSCGTMRLLYCKWYIGNCTTHKYNFLVIMVFGVLYLPGLPSLQCTGYTFGNAVIFLSTYS